MSKPKESYQLEKYCVICEVIFSTDRIDARYCSEVCRKKESDVKNIVCGKTLLLNKLHILAYTLLRLDESLDVKNLLDLLIDFCDQVLEITEGGNLNKLRKLNRKFLEITKIHFKEQPPKVLRAI